eukprot:3005164-Pleurochrysis_carterae.AAC.1
MRVHATFLTPFEIVMRIHATFLTPFEIRAPAAARTHAAKRGDACAPEPLTSRTDRDDAACVQRACGSWCLRAEC